MLNAIYGFCYFSTVLGLVIETSINELVRERVPGTTLRILLSAVCNQNFGKFLQGWLVTDLASVQDIYDTSCQYWTSEHIRHVASLAKQSPPYLRNLLLSPKCLKKAPESVNVHNYLSRSMVPFKLHKVSRSWDRGLWKRLLEYLPPEHSSSWCRWVPFRDEKWLKSLDLPFHLSLKCLVTKYVKRDSVIKYTIDQIPSAQTTSLSRLVMTLAKIKGNSLRGLRKSVRLAVCSTTKKTLFQELNAWVVGCTDYTTWSAKTFSLLVKTALEQRGELLILALRLLLDVIGMEAINKRLRRFFNPGHATMPQSLQLVMLYEENIDEPLEARKEFFSFFRVDHDEFLLQTTSNGFWISNMSQFYEMPLKWRLRYYVKHQMYGARECVILDSGRLIPKFYALGIFESEQTIQKYIRRQVSSTKGMSISADYIGTITITSVDTDNLTFELILDMMVYGIIKFGHLVAHLDSRICSESDADSELASYLNDALNDTHYKWTLDYFIRGTEFCSLLSTQHNNSDGQYL